MRSSRLFALLLLLSCRPQLEVASNAAVTCQTRTDCPDGWTCDDTRGLCVNGERSDFEAPHVDGAAAITPSVVGANARFRVSFRANEALALEPEVSMSDGGQLIALTYESGDGSEASPFVFVYMTTGAELPGLKPLTVRMVDLAQNRAELSLGVGPTLDFTAPEVVSGSESTAITGSDPQLRITRIGPAASVRVAFSVDEPLAEPPTLRSDPEGLSFALVSRSANTQIFEATFAGAPADGAVHLTAELRDLAGNSALRVLESTLSVDTVAPPAPVADGHALLRRAPWGAHASEGAPRCSVSGAAGTVAEEGTVIVREGDVEIARGTSADDGSFGPIILAADHARVDLVFIDGAANASPPRSVRDVEWTASLGRKVSGSRTLNPHVLEEWPTFGLTLTPPVRFEPTSLAPVQARDGQTLQTRGTGVWRLLTPVSGASPGGRLDHALAFDSARDVSVLFGGSNSSSVRLNDTWEWSGRQWNQRCDGVPIDDVCASPTARTGHAMAYDLARGETLLFGGFTGSAASDELWAWTGAGWNKRCGQGTTCAGPSGFFQSSMVYDPLRDRSVLFGGRASVTMLGDTWEWDGAGWTKACAAGSPCAGPGTLLNAKAVFDASRGTVVLAFGVPSLSTPVTEANVWEWDGSQWTLRCGPAHPTCVGAPPDAMRNSGALVYDEERQAVSLLGSSQVWVLTDTGWDQRCDGAPASDVCPTLNIRSAAAAYESSRRQSVVFGGLRVSSFVDETSLYTGSDWSTACGGSTTCTNITATYGHGATATAADEILLHGGASASLTSSDRTWRWTGTAWQQLCGSGGPACTSTLAMQGMAMVRDLERDQILAFGGLVSLSPPADYTAELYRWNGAGWTLLCPGGGCTTRPMDREGTASAFMAKSGDRRVIFFGGDEELRQSTCSADAVSATPPCYFDDTWAWDGSDFTKLCGKGTACVGPSARTRAAMVYDAAREVIVMHGGAAGASFDETWEFDGTAWTLRCGGATGCSAPSAAAPALVYDPDRQRSVLFPGADGSDTWEWNGTAWSKRCDRALGCSGPAGSLERAAFTLEPRTGRLFLTGGRRADTGTATADTWAFSGQSAARPAHVFSLAFSAADAEGATLSAVDVRWNGGGSGAPSGALQNGVNASAWVGGTWKTIGTAPGSPASPALMEAHIVASHDLAVLPLGDDRTMRFALTPSAVAGQGDGVVATDDVEVTVRYVLP